MHNVCDFMTKEEVDLALIERDSLRKQLAKANERVEELEETYGFFTNENGDYLFDPLTPEKLFQWLNKNDIEQKIEALQELFKKKSHKNVHHLIEIVIDSCKNQLRKEQEK